MSDVVTTNEDPQDIVDDTVTDTTSTQVDMIPKAEMQKVLDDMMKYKKQAREFEGKIKDQEVTDLKRQEEWQKVAELKEREASEAVEKSTRLEASFLNERKFSALKNAALANGIRKEALSDLELLDFSDDVAIETTSTGRINVIGAEAAIKRLKADRPYWFGKSMGSINPGSPEIVDGGGEITLDMVMKAQASANKSGVYAEYSKVLKAYQAQKGA